MTTQEFNNKYKDYLEQGHYGLDIGIEPVITYLDYIFEDFIKLPSFKYSQIKLKFNMARFYFTMDLQKLIIPLMTGIELKIDQIVRQYDEEQLAAKLSVYPIRTLSPSEVIKYDLKEREKFALLDKVSDSMFYVSDVERSCRAALLKMTPQHPRFNDLELVKQP